MQTPTSKENIMSTDTTTKSMERRPYRAAYLDEVDEPNQTPDPNAANTQGANATPNDDAEPQGPEEKTYKKRYGDLRKHAQKLEQDLRAEINQLKTKLEAPADYKPPADPNKLREWIEQFPEVAKNIETIADQRARERAEALQKQLDEVRAQTEQALKERAEQFILRKHPDFDELRDSDDFHDWAESQPKAVQDWIYENKTDADLLSRALDLYKSDRGIKSDKGKKNKRQDDAAAAATAVVTSGRVDDPTAPKGRIWKTSEIARMKPAEFEKNEADIDLAQKEGRIVNDL
jgi:hypothetical protein